MRCQMIMGETDTSVDDSYTHCTLHSMLCIRHKCWVFASFKMCKISTKLKWIYNHVSLCQVWQTLWIQNDTITTYSPASFVSTLNILCKNDFDEIFVALSLTYFKIQGFINHNGVCIVVWWYSLLHKIGFLITVPEMNSHRWNFDVIFKLLKCHEKLANENIPRHKSSEHELGNDTLNHTKHGIQLYYFISVMQDMAIYKYKFEMRPKCCMACVDNNMNIEWKCFAWCKKGFECTFKSNEQINSIYSD